MKLTFFGAAGEVGRSCIMVESKDTKILLDAGVKLGSTEEYPLIGDDELRDVDAIVVTHAHLDHSGYLGHIFSSGWNGQVYSTKPTYELTNVLISDYIKISNPQNLTEEGIKRMQRHFTLVEYHKNFSIKNLRLRLMPAGHILGSAAIHIDDGSEKLLYTGDINFRKTRLLNAANLEHIEASTLITESTYGGKEDIFPTERSISSAMLKSIGETIKQGGKIIIPSFAVGRAQEVLLMLDDYMRSGLLEKVPIYMDGMINKAMRIHRHNVLYCRKELQNRILMNEDDPFKSPNFYEVKTKRQRYTVAKEGSPSIIVTTSGMLTGGPVLRYLELLGKDQANKMILVGYQAEGTAGRDLIENKRTITVNGRKFEIGMAVEYYHLSAHADRPQLIKFISQLHGLRKIFIVHGERRKSEDLKEALRQRFNTAIPTLKSEFTI
ncbi:MAG: MBL fold metallo-hydrolase [Candidatus Micrarchaeaceae archaeon]